MKSPLERVAEKLGIDPVALKKASDEVKAEDKKAGRTTGKKDKDFKYPAQSLDSVLRFGKYKDQTIHDTIVEDSGWITWAIENTDFTLDDAAYAFYKESV